MQLQNFDTAAFLANHWQKKPLLIRNPWTSWRNPLEPDELAGLACEDSIESRLVIHKRDTLKVEHGPFKEKRFAKLGKKPWTLLVQSVDHHVPDVAALLTPFRFIPNWRIDDVMVSYASDGGGVGAHFDQYDVFLVQGLGKRRWRIGARCDDATALLPHDDLRLLAEFEATEEWVLGPGDILYLPPGTAHEGIAVGDDCMTYSIGFRAPSRADLVAGFAEHVAAGLSEDDRYTDPELRAQPNPGEITADALDRLHAMVMEAMADRDAFARWFGEYSTTPKNPDIDWRPDEPIGVEQVRARLTGGAVLRRKPASRFSFERAGPDAVLLFADGQSFACTTETMALAEDLSSEDRVAIAPRSIQSSSALSLIATLLDQGSVAFDGEQ